MKDRGEEGVEVMGDGGSFAPPIPQEFPPLPLRDSRGRESQPEKGEGQGVGVQEASAFFRNLLSLGRQLANRFPADHAHPAPELMIPYPINEIQPVSLASPPARAGKDQPHVEAEAHSPGQCVSDEKGPSELVMPAARRGRRKGRRARSPIEMFLELRGAPFPIPAGPF